MIYRDEVWGVRSMYVLFIVFYKDNVHENNDELMNYYELCLCQIKNYAPDNFYNRLSPFLFFLHSEAQNVLHSL